MKGTVTMFDVGMSLEFYLYNIEEFIYPSSDISFNPFFTFGFKYSSYTNSLSSELGDWEQDISVLPSKYTRNGALDIGSDNALSIVFGLGTRYKLTERLDLSAQFTFQYFFSDRIDGLQAQVFENKNNEWLMNMQFGLIYHLNFNSPLF